MKNELTKLTKKQMKKIAKMHVKGKKESALETGQRIHQEIEKKLVSHLSEETIARFTECKPLVSFPCSIQMTKSDSLFLQQWGRMFRGRLPEEINPKPQPSYFELNELYGYVSSRQYSVFEPVSLAMNLWFYSNYGLEC